jgi:hypothetical protein
MSHVDKYIMQSLSNIYQFIVFIFNEYTCLATLCMYICSVAYQFIFLILLLSMSHQLLDADHLPFRSTQSRRYQRKRSSSFHDLQTVLVQTSIVAPPILKGKGSDMADGIQLPFIIPPMIKSISESDISDVRARPGWTRVITAPSPLLRCDTTTHRNSKSLRLLVPPSPCGSVSPMLSPGQLLSPQWPPLTTTSSINLSRGRKSVS